MIYAVLDAFLRTYRLDAPAVVAALDGWTVSHVGASAIRSGVELVLTRPGQPRIVVAITPAVAGGQHLAATATLHLSYYAEDGVDHRGAADRVRALARALAACEGAAPRRLPLAPSVGARFVELRINRDCNERCRFCNTPPDSPAILPDRASVLAHIAAAAAGGCTGLLLTGRETTLDPALPDYVAAARAAGIPDVRVQTNATSLGRGPILPALLAAGVTGFEVSLHTVTPATFAALIGPAELLPHTLAGLDALAATPGLHLTIVTVVTTANLDELPALFATIASRWPTVRSVVLSPVAPVGDGADALDLVPPYARLGPAVAAGLTAAAEVGLNAVIPARCGLPPCVLPPALRDRHDAVRSPRGGAIEAGKRKPAACATCALDHRCPGVWAAYLERHGPAGLTPIAAQ